MANGEYFGCLTIWTRDEEEVSLQKKSKMFKEKQEQTQNAKV